MLLTPLSKVTFIIFLDFFFNKSNALFIRCAAPVTYTVKNICIIKVILFIFFKLIKNKIPITKLCKSVIIIVRVNTCINLASINTLPFAYIKRNTVCTAPGKLLGSALQYIFPAKKLVRTVIAFAICPILLLALSINFFDLLNKL